MSLLPWRLKVFQSVREVMERRWKMYSKSSAETSKKSHMALSPLIFSEATNHFGNLSHTDQYLHQSKARYHHFTLFGVSFPQRNFSFFRQISL